MGASDAPKRFKGAYPPFISYQKERLYEIFEGYAD